VIKNYLRQYNTSYENATLRLNSRVKLRITILQIPSTTEKCFP